MAGAVVVDASLAIKWVVVEPYTAEAVALLTDWNAGSIDRIAPVLFGYEATNALYRKRPAVGGAGWVAQNLADLLAAVTILAPTFRALERAAEIAELLGQPAAYDAQYIALAEAEGAPLWTADERFWRAARGPFPFVQWVGSGRT